jgi:nucleoside-diphosphate-sugar epimerase
VSPRILVTGGSGFIGAALVKELLQTGATVRVLDDNSRGAPRRLAAVQDEIEFVTGDVRDPATVDTAVRGVDEVHHLAFVNGTEFFYSDPDLVLDVGVKGIVNVLDACRRHDVGTLVLASSSEVYQTPPNIPTNETVPLVVPDPQNPRYSYGAGKIISEVMAINHGRKYFDRVLIFRPHNVYGPDMGFEHVIPQLVMRTRIAADRYPFGVIRLQIQGSGQETRSFCHISDLVRGVMTMRARGEHLGIYHVGTAEEIAIADLARRVAAVVGRELDLVPSSILPGSTPHRCPDIGKLGRLGYRPRVSLDEGLPPTVHWYWQNSHLADSIRTELQPAV